MSQNNKKLTQDDVRNIVAMRKEGKTIKSIATIFGITEQHAGKILNGKKLTKWTKGILPTIVDNRLSLSDKDVKSILELRKQQITQSNIARKFNISQSMVSKICLGSVRKNISKKQKFIFNCKYCGVEFEKIYNVQEYCSPHCRLWYNIDKKPFRLFKPSSCYIWKLDKDKDGYGKVSWIMEDGKISNTVVTRLILEEKLGRKMLPGTIACHTCDNPPCCNPKHLYEGTHKTNKADCTSRGRANSKLKAQDVKNILTMIKHCKGYSEIGNLYNVSEVTIWKIAKKRSWKHIPR